VSRTFVRLIPSFHSTTQLAISHMEPERWEEGTWALLHQGGFREGSYLPSEAQLTALKHACGGGDVPRNMAALIPSFGGIQVLPVQAFLYHPDGSIILRDYLKMPPPKRSPKQEARREYKQRFKREKLRLAAQPYVSRLANSAVTSGTALQQRTEVRPRRASKYRCAGCPDCHVMTCNTQLSTARIANCIANMPKKTLLQVRCPIARNWIYSRIARLIADTYERLERDLSVSGRIEDLEERAASIPPTLNAWRRLILSMFNSKNIKSRNASHLDVPRYRFVQQWCAITAMLHSAPTDAN